MGGSTSQHLLNKDINENVFCLSRSLRFRITATRAESSIDTSANGYAFFYYVYRADGSLKNVGY